MPTVNIHNVKNQPLFTFDQLNDDAKQTARLGFLSVELDGVKKWISDYKRKTIHQKVNSNALYQIIRQKMFINGLKSNTLKLDKMIVGNLCQFLSDGTYVLYSINTTN